MPALSLRVTGRVQGVGYRAWAVKEARALGLSGWVRNRADGSVEALVAGADEAVNRFVAAARKGPRHAMVTGLACESAAPDAPGSSEPFTAWPSL